VGYIKPISRLSKEDNLGGLLQLKICRKDDITFIPAPTGRTVYDVITFKPGAAFTPWDVTLETLRIQRQDNVTREGSSKRISLPFTIPKDRIDLSDMFDIMKDDEFIVVFVENGRQKLFGLLHAPVRFTYSHDSGANFGDLNAYNCRFYYDGPDNVYFYNGTVGSAPSGPPPSVVYFNGEPIASLAPGETLHIESDYSLSDYFTIT
jgi:hypothetical protein